MPNTFDRPSGSVSICHGSPRTVAVDFPLSGFKERNAPIMSARKINSEKSLVMDQGRSFMAHFNNMWQYWTGSTRGFRV
jgi:hypothetical protein